jgi:hypothetical protein
VRVAGAGAALLLTAGLLSGCSGDGQDAYCAALRDERPTLQDLSAGRLRDGMLAEAITAFEELRDQAPADIADEWDTFLDAWRVLADTLHDAGADESMFRTGKRPAGLTDEQYDAISEAAAKLRSGIEQHALDVCKIDLSAAGLAP